MVKKTKAKQIKKKRKWFEITAPDVYNSKELEPILSAEPEALINRTIGIDLSVITNSPKDQNKKLLLKIVNVKGETATTEVIKYFITDSYLQRSLKKFPEQFFHILTATSKDGKKIKVKVSLGGKTRMYRSQKTEILNTIKEVCEKEILQQNSTGIFVPNYFRELELKLKKSTRLVYPIEHIKIWKVSVI